VFRAESGISCRIELDVARVSCDGHVGDLLSRRVCALLQRVSERVRARVVTLSLAASDGGGVLIGVDVDEPVGTPDEQMSATARTRLASLDERLLALGIHVDVTRGSLSTRLTVPSALVSVD